MIGGSWRRPRVAVLISGRGSNMLALAAAASDPAYPADLALVVSDNPEAPGLVEARARFGLPVLALPWQKGQRRVWESDLDRALQAEQIGLLCLAGFMRILSGDFTRRWLGRVLNIHPSLLPAYPGLATHARVLAAGETRHGASVHLVDAGVDTGPVLAQAALAVRPTDTAEILADRVLRLEHRLYPLALAAMAQGRVTVPPTPDAPLLIDDQPGPWHLDAARLQLVPPIPSTR